MPVFYTPIPQNLRVGLANVSGHISVYLCFFLHFHSSVICQCTYDQCLLVTEMVLINIFEVLRVYLGYVGNLKEKVPELAGFWLISFLFQLPILLFFISDEDTIILPHERAVHSLYLGFLLGELLA
uniref:Uncharacterized protein n=1 Tax=Cyprinus carpio TaxID=7962 RepID=A0A8C2GMD4_CYPCA